MSKALELAASLRRMDTFTAYQREQLLLAASELTRLAAMEQAVMDAQPVAWARSWYIQGQTPKKEKNKNGRLAWRPEHKMLPLTHFKCIGSDEPLYTLKGIKP